MLADFGLAHFLRGDATRWAGSRPYVAPEVLTRAPAVCGKADIWSAGVLLYEALAGETSGATAGDAVSCAEAGLAWAPPSLPARADPSGVFSALLRLMLTVDPERRPDCSTLLQHPLVSRELSRIIAEHETRRRCAQQPASQSRCSAGSEAERQRWLRASSTCERGAAGRALAELRGSTNRASDGAAAGRCSGSGDAGDARAGLRAADRWSARSDPL